MNRDKHQQITDLFLEVCDLEAEAQESTLAALCGKDLNLIKEVQTLLLQDRLPGLEDEVDPDQSPAEQRVEESLEKLDDKLDRRKVIAPSIQGYELTALIGQGGVSQVWRATDLAKNQEVAIKVHNLTAFSSEDAATRFEREIKLAASLDHPHIAAIYHSGKDGDIYYYTLQLIKGKRLDIFARDRELHDEAILRLFSIVCSALAHAHERSIIHRDLKPSNILVSSQGHPYVLDFGLAKAMEGVMKEASITMEGDIIGTLEFMAPEQAVGDQQKIGMATDIYSMGLILYRLLTKRSPIDTSGSRYALLKRMQNGEITSPEEFREDLSPEIVRIVMRCLEREPENRYASAKELNKDLRSVIRSIRFK
ncbi:MAG: serine/threonine-protein kinase [Pirellulales bacterium]|nr:serine/threonine-protein kinase [Pirellulales bacterium]